MAFKLPDETAFGALGPIRSERQISSYDTTGYAKGAAAIAKGAADIGEGISSAARSIAIVNAKEAAAEQQLQIARAEGDKTSRLIALSTAPIDPNNPEAFPGWVEAEGKKVIDETTAKITDERARELTRLRFTTEMEHARERARARAKDARNDLEVRTFNENSQAMRDAYLKTDNEEERKSLIDSISVQADILAEKGVIGLDKAREIKRDWVTKAVDGALKLKTPEEQVAILGGIGRALNQTESSNNQYADNPLRYVGLLQIGAPHATTLGIYKPGSGENINDKNAQGRWSGSKWSGEWNIPGFPEIRTVEDFKNNRAAQLKVSEMNIAYLDKEITRLGLTRFVGQEINGVPVTKEGLIAGAHLGGVNGLQKFLTQGIDPHDGGKGRIGTRISNYVANFSRQFGSSLARSVSLVFDPVSINDSLNSAEARLEQEKKIAADTVMKDFGGKINEFARSGRGTLPSEEEIASHPALISVSGAVDKVLELRDKAAGSELAFQKFKEMFEAAGPNQYSLNPDDKTHRDGVDMYYSRALATRPENKPALQVLREVAKRAGFVPPLAVKELQRQINSSNVQDFATAIEVLKSIPDASLGKASGAADVEEIRERVHAKIMRDGGINFNAIKYAQEIKDEDSTLGPASPVLKNRKETITEKLKEVTLAKMEAALQSTGAVYGETSLIRSWLPAWIAGRGVDGTEAGKNYLLNEFQQFVREAYLSGRNKDLAEATGIAAQRFAKQFGVSTLYFDDKIKGSQEPRLMRFAPGAWSAYGAVAASQSEIANRDDALRRVAAEEIKKAGGALLDEKKIYFQFNVNGDRKQNEMRFATPNPIDPPKYIIYYQDKDGKMQVLPKGPVGFTPDDLRAAQSAMVVENRPDPNVIPVTSLSSYNPLSSGPKTSGNAPPSATSRISGGATAERVQQQRTELNSKIKRVKIDDVADAAWDVAAAVGGAANAGLKTLGDLPLIPDSDVTLNKLIAENREEKNKKVKSIYEERARLREEMRNR